MSDFFSSDYKNLPEQKPLTAEAFNTCYNEILEYVSKSPPQAPQPPVDILPSPDSFDAGDIVIAAHGVWVVSLDGGLKNWELSQELTKEIPTFLFSGGS